MLFGCGNNECLRFRFFFSPLLAAGNTDVEALDEELDEELEEELDEALDDELEALLDELDELEGVISTVTVIGPPSN